MGDGRRRGGGAGGGVEFSLVLSLCGHRYRAATHCAPVGVGERRSHSFVGGISAAVNAEWEPLMLHARGPAWSLAAFFLLPIQSGTLLPVQNGNLLPAQSGNLLPVQSVIQWQWKRSGLLGCCALAT
eukprot:345656-Chlamydomonas_euryale.AAC.3